MDPDDIVKFEIAIPGSLYDISSDPQSKLMEIANMLNEDYPEIDMVKLAENLKSEVVKKGKGIQIKFTISTKEEKELLDYFIGDLAGFAEQYYADPLDPSEKARAKRAFEAGYNALEKLRDFTPPDTVPDDISSIDTPTNVVDDVPFTDDDVAEVTNDYVKENWNKQKTTADGVVMRINDNNELEVLVVKRKRGPHRGDWALPGGIQDDKTMQLFAEAELRWNSGTNDMTKSNDYIFGNLKGDVTAGINNIDKVALTTEFTALKELYEEVGLDTKEVFTTNKPLTPKYNRFDWDARATKGVVVGGSFVFVHDNDWQPKAGDDALNAEWKTVKSILDGDTKLAFGHNEWITQVLENRQLIKDVGIDKVFDDNVKYIYGMTKPENTLGNYRDVMDQLRVINKNNKSKITELIEAANKVRVTKGMEEIPLDRSNIQGSAESVIKNMRLGYGDPAQIQRYMQPEHFLKDITSKYQINFNTSVADYNGEELLEQINDIYSRTNPNDPTVFTMEDLINGNEKLVGLEYKGLEANLSEQGIDNVARQMQEKMLQSVEERMVYLHRLGFEDDVILDELRTIYKENIDTEKFVDYLRDLIRDGQENVKFNQRPVTSQIKSGLRGLELTWSNQRNVFDVLEVDAQKTIIEYLKTDTQLNFLDDVFTGNKFMTMEPLEFWSKYGGITDRSLDQRSTYVKDGVLHFQTNHGTPGPNENVLNFIKTVENKYKDQTNIQSIAQELKADRPIFFDETLKFVDPTSGRTGLIGPVLYTTTNPFIGAGYAKQSNDSMTPDTIKYLIEEDLHRFFRVFRDTNPEILEDVVNIAKENGILIDVIRNKSDGSIANLRGVSNIDQYKSLSTANIANIQGSVNEENVLKINQSTLPGQGDIKLQNFWRQVLDEFDENWFVKDLQNGTRFIKGMPHPEFKDYNSEIPKLREEMIPYVALQKTRVIPGAENKANLENYFTNKRKFDPDFIPNFGFILGSGGILPNLLSDLNQSDENWNYILQQIQKNAPVIGFEDQQSYRYVADILDNNHQYFNFSLSGDLQIMSDYIKASLAIDDKDYVTAAKYLGLEFLDGDWTPIADQINETLKNNIDVHFTNNLKSGNIRKVGSSVYKIQNDIKVLLRPEDVTEWDNNFKNKTRIEKFNNFYKANNLPTIVTPENANAFIDTVQSYDLSGTSNASWDKLKVDQKIYTMAGNNGYEVVLSTGGGRVDTMPHWVVGIIDPSNKLQTNQPKTLDVEIKNWAFLTEDDAEIFYELGRKNVDDLTDADLQLMSKYINPDNLVDINVSEEQLINFDKINKEKGIFWNDMIGKLENANTENLSVKILINQLEFQNLHIAHQLGQVPKEAVAASGNSLLLLLAQAPEPVKAKFYTGAVNTLGILNQYAKPAAANTLKYGGKAMDKFDKWVLGPAAIDILASRISGSGSQYETIGGALADTMARYEDETPDSVIEMLYGNKNNPEAKNLAGVNIAYPVTQSIEYGKDKFKEYVYDNNVFGIKSIVNFIKPKAIEALKTVTDKAGLNDWVYNVKRDMIVEMIMKENNIPYTKNNIDLYTKNYEEQNPREVDRFGNELPDNYDYSWVSSIPETYLARDFRVDERIRTGDRYTGSGGGGGQKKL
jgi:8-oxo-dGTP pyrophosphatase MutT (NUDIX family)